MARHHVISMALLFIVLLGTLFALPVTAQDDPATCAPPQPLAIGMYVYSRPGVFIRNLPSASGGQVEYYNRSYTLLITDGPVCNDGYNWWRVEGPGNHGWVIEGTPDFIFLFPADDLNNVPEPCPPPLALGAGIQARIIDGSRVRETPSLNGRVLSALPGGSIITITGGVACADGMNWWPVQVPFGSSNELVNGWVAEGQNGIPFISVDLIPVPTPIPCAPPYYRLNIGIRAVVMYENFEAKNLRAEPDMNGAIIEELLDGVAVDIIGGPICADGLNWWQVTVVTAPNATGWLAEGVPYTTGYWLRPIEFFE